MDFIAFNDPVHPTLNALASKINAEAKIAGVPPCALAAIVDNETGGQNILQYGTDTTTMTLSDGSRPGVGLCQITAGVDWSDLQHPKYQGYDLWDEAQNLYVAAAYFLAPAIANAARLQRDYPDRFAQFGDGQQLFYAFAGYNEGDGTVNDRFAKDENPDDDTTNGYATRAYAAYADFIRAAHQTR